MYSFTFMASHAAFLCRPTRRLLRPLERFFSPRPPLRPPPPRQLSSATARIRRSSILLVTVHVPTWADPSAFDAYLASVRAQSPRHIEPDRPTSLAREPSRLPRGACSVCSSCSRLQLTLGRRDGRLVPRRPAIALARTGGTLFSF